MKKSSEDLDKKIADAIVDLTKKTVDYYEKFNEAYNVQGNCTGN